MKESRSKNQPANRETVGDAHLDRNVGPQSNPRGKKRDVRYDLMSDEDLLTEIVLKLRM